MGMRERFLRDLPCRCEACGYRAPQIPAACTEMLGLEVHHIVPRLRGGPDERENLVLLCCNCHDVAEAMARQGGMPTERDGFVDDMRTLLRRPREFGELLTRRFADIKDYGFFWIGNRQYTRDGKRVRPSVARGPYLERLTAEVSP